MGQRASRVAEELRKVVAQILLEELSGDPRMGFITVTAIHVTDDLRMGRIYYSVLGSEEQKKATEEALAEELGSIRRMVAERLSLKFAMEVRFEPDPSIDHSFKIDSILKKIKEEEK